MKFGHTLKSGTPGTGTSRARSGRFRRSIRVRLADMPGSLQRLTSIVAEHGVDIVRLEIVSQDGTEAWDDIELAAISEGQLDDVVRAIKDAALDVIGLPATWVMRDWALSVLDAIEHMSMCRTAAVVLEAFTAAGASIASTEHACVLIRRPMPDADVSEVRLNRLRSAAEFADPVSVAWVGDADAIATATTALTAAAPATTPVRDDRGIAGAVISFPAGYGDVGYLVVVGERPPFLAPERKRLEVFARVAAPHLSTGAMERTA